MADLQEKEQEHGHTQESCYRIEANLTAARAKVAELNVETERTRGKLDAQARQIGGIDERLAAGEAETQELELRHQTESAELAAYAEGVAKLEQEAAAAKETLNSKTHDRDVLQAKQREKEQSLETARHQVLRLMSEASTLRHQLVQTDEFLAAVDRDSARTRREEEAAMFDLTRLEEGKADLSARLSARQMELESLAANRSRVEIELKENQQQSLAMRQRLNALRDSLSKQKARKESLEGILSHRAYSTESVKRLFTDVERGQTEGFRPMGLLADYVEVTNTEWEKASEEFLHEELEYVVVHGIYLGAAWEKSVLLGPRIKNPDERDQSIREARFNAPVEWRKIYPKTATVGMQTIDDDECYEVLLTPPTGKPVHQFYSKKSGLLVRTTMVAASQMGEVDVEVNVSDYKNFGGVLVPTQSRQKAGNQELKITVNDVRANEGIPDSRFEPPPDVSAMIRKAKASEEGRNP